MMPLANSAGHDAAASAGKGGPPQLTLGGTSNRRHPSLCARAMPECSGVTRAEVGRNAAKMMLYYALKRCGTPCGERRAIAPYNRYGSGFTLGMSFQGPDGRRGMLWPEDLRGIAEKGQGRNSRRIANAWRSE